MTSVRKLQNSTINLERFKDISSRFASMACVDDFDLVPYRDPALPYFSALPSEAQEAILQQMELMVHGNANAVENAVCAAPAQAWSFVRFSFSCRRFMDVFPNIH